MGLVVFSGTLLQLTDAEEAGADIWNVADPLLVLPVNIWEGGGVPSHQRQEDGPGHEPTWVHQSCGEGEACELQHQFNEAGSNDGVSSRLGYQLSSGAPWRRKVTVPLLFSTLKRSGVTGSAEECLLFHFSRGRFRFCVWKIPSRIFLFNRTETTGRTTQSLIPATSPTGQWSARWRESNRPQSKPQVQLRRLSACPCWNVCRALNCVCSPGQWSFSLPLSELYSLRRARFSLGRNFLVLTSRGGHPLPPLHFHRGGTRELLRALQRYIILDQWVPAALAWSSNISNLCPVASLWHEVFRKSYTCFLKFWSVAEAGCLCMAAFERSLNVTRSPSPGHPWTGGSSSPTLTTRARSPSPSISCSSRTTAAPTLCR